MSILSFISFFSSFVFSFTQTLPFLPGRPAFPSPVRIFTPPPKHLEKAERGRMPPRGYGREPAYPLWVHAPRPPPTGLARVPPSNP